VIVARRFGWSAVSDRPMDWEEFMLARQLLTDETVGRAVRAAAEAEDASFKRTKKRLGGS